MLKIYWYVLVHLYFGEIQDLVQTIEDVDVVKFTDVVKDFDSFTRLVCVINPVFTYISFGWKIGALSKLVTANGEGFTNA